MFDVGFSELVLMAIVALVVLGPEKLPHAARVAGAWVGRIRRTVSNMQAEIEREVSAQELRERLQKEIDAANAMANEADLQQPFQAVIAGIQDLQAEANSILPPAAVEGTPVRAVTAAPTPETVPAGASEPVAATIPAEAAATPPAPPVDGEQAYREWLASQKNANLRPAETATPPAKDDAAS